MSCLKCGKDDDRYKLVETEGGPDAVEYLCDDCQTELELGGFEPQMCGYSDDCVNVVRYQAIGRLGEEIGTNAYLCEEHFQELTEQ